ncbi:single-stranded DNA-binding protein [Rubidibacter lacunae KORDI 51-2]|uniref:Single-stranded DNA-binding protein n=1 Tax=Rubidibacter lacunae KORDI 51-2 TaxID=582515 RepID=U5D6M6_9CHRO|nr:single-stranded DNA-binding protein [Rubidibacter lacunae]ERN40313.1 single-stranded DNA-binding protein [Rubidibacter lacunae KORDI 51-2]
MNSCVLLARIVRSPELRYTPDNQTAIAEMMVEFPGLRAEDPPATLKVVGWGNLANEIADSYTEGDRVLLEGRLRMNVLELDGYKEKRAELTVARVHRLEGDIASDSAAVASLPRATPVPAPQTPEPSFAPEPTPTPSSAPEYTPEELDDIPF